MSLISREQNAFIRASQFEQVARFIVCKHIELSVMLIIPPALPAQLQTGKNDQPHLVIGDFNHSDYAEIHPFLNGGFRDIYADLHLTKNSDLLRSHPTFGELFPHFDNVSCMTLLIWCKAESNTIAQSKERRKPRRMDLALLKATSQTKVRCRHLTSLSPVRARWSTTGKDGGRPVKVSKILRSTTGRNNQVFASDHLPIEIVLKI